MKIHKPQASALVAFLLILPSIMIALQAGCDKGKREYEVVGFLSP
jgi:hypothetical protein